jgi:hypothetical protein
MQAELNARGTGDADEVSTVLSDISHSETR